MPTAFIYTMNVTAEIMKAADYLTTFGKTEFYLEKIFVKPVAMYSNDTYQFDDYSKYKVECFSEADKAKTRQNQFPLDCQKAFELGADLINFR